MRVLRSASLARPAALMLLASLTLFAAGCGKQDPRTQLPLDSTACNVGLPSLPTLVNVIGYQSPGMPFFGEQMAKCSRGKPLQVRYQMLPYEELINKSTIAFSSSAPSPYHIIHVYDQLLVEWASKGWLSPLDDLVDKYRQQYHLDDVPASVWDQMRVNGHIYAIPAIQNVETFLYRKDLFAKYGLSVPRTYDDLEPLCAALKKSGEAKFPLVMMYSKMSDHFAYEFHDLLHSLGGRWFGEDGTPAFNGPEGAAALQKMIHLYRTCLSPNVIGLTPADVLIGLQQGQFLMTVLWMNESPQLDNPSASRFPGKFGFAPAPAACEKCPPAAYWAQDSWVIPSRPGVDRDLLFRIAMEALGRDNQAKAAAFTLVTRSTIVQAEANHYWQPGLESVARGSSSLARLPYMYLATEAIERYGIEALLGHMSAQDALDNAAKATQASMREQGFVK